MKNLIKKTINSVSFTVLFVLIAFTLSCEIGLGAAVDTESPVITIESPVSDAVIRDAFRLAGTWSDDGTISSLEIVLESPDGSSAYGPFDGTIIESQEENGTNTWFCVIDPKTDGIPDGSYEVKLAISDEGGHTTTQSRLLVIDNTAPIIVLQRPGKKAEDKDTDSYGQTFTLEGQAADDNNVSLIRVNIYSDPECTQLRHYVDLTNVPPTISLDVAKFGDDNYAKIYGSAQKDGSKDFYCTIVGYDGAVRYPADGSTQTPEDLLGNAVTYYYLYEDIAATVLTQNKITDIYHMLNGSYLKADAGRSAEVVNTVNSELIKNIVGKGRFSLNPENNPMFTVSGKSVLKKDGNDFTNEEYSVTNGSSLVIEVSPGLDGILLKDDENFKVYAMSCDSSGNPADTQKIYPTYNRIKSGSNYKFVTNITNAEGFVVGKDYILGFDGTDLKGNEIKGNGGTYGFHLASSGAAPTLVIDSSIPTTTNCGKNASYTISGTTSALEGIPVVTVYLDSDASTPLATITENNYVSVTKDNTSGRNICYFSYTIPASAFNQTESRQYAVIVKSSLELFTTVQRLVSYDVSGPEIRIDEKTPQHRKGAYNKIISINGSIQDDYSGIDSAKFIYTGNNAVQPVTITNPARFSVEVDTEKLINGEFRIESVDKNGNATVHSETILVDQNSDIPEISCPQDYGWVTTYTDIDAFKAAIPGMTTAQLRKNIFTKGGSMRIMLYDDDGSATVTYTLTSEDGGEIITDKEDIVFRGSEGTKYDMPIPDSEGKYYKVTLSVKDAAGTTFSKIKLVDSNKDYTNQDIPEDGFWIYVSGGVPKITKVEPDITWANITQVMKISGNNSGINPFTIAVKDNSGTTHNLDTANPLDPAFNWTNYPYGYVEYKTGSETTHQEWTHVSNPSVSGKYTYVVEDNFHNVSEAKEVNYQVDKDLPSLTSYPAVPLVNLDQSTYITFSINSSDVTSGVAAVNYYIGNDNSTDASSVQASDWKPMNRTNTGYSATVNLSDFGITADCDKYIYFASTDAAGNTAYSPSANAVKVTCDKQLPSITVIEGDTVKLTKAAIPGGGSTAQTKLNVVVNDTNAAGIKYKINSAAVWSEVTTEKTAGSNTYELPVTNIATDGTETEVVIKGIDANGRESAQKKAVIKCDAIAPVVNVTAPNGKTGTSALAVNTTEFSGTVTEVGGTVEELKYMILEASAAAPLVTTSGWKTLTPGKNWNFYINLKEGVTSGETLGEGSYKLYMYAKDDTGNYSAVKTVDFDADMSKPAVTQSNTAKYANNTFTLSGTVTETNKLGSFVIKRKIKGNDGSESVVKTFTLGSGNEIPLTPANAAWIYTVTKGTSDFPSDGTYIYSVVASDIFGKQNETLTKEIIIDTTIPQLNAAKILDTNSANEKKDIGGVNWYNSRTIKLKVTPETDLSGIETVSYSTVPQTSRTAGDWTELRENNGNYTGNVIFTNDGDNTVYFKVTDNAGNILEDDSTCNKVFKIDTVKPRLTAPESINKYMPDSGITLSVTTSDDTPSCGSVKLTVNEWHKGTAATDTYAADTNPDKTKEITLTSASQLSSVQLPLQNAGGSPVVPADGHYKYILTLEDGLGNKADQVVYETTVDKNAPVLNTIDPATNSLISSTYKKIQGTVKEEVSLKAVYYQFVKDGETAPTVSGISDFTAANTKWKAATSEGSHGTAINWYFEQNFTSGSDSGTSLGEGKYILYVYALDEAGNYTSTPLTATYNVDMAAPKVTANAPEYVNRTTNSGSRTVNLSGTITETNELSSFKIFRSGTAAAIKTFEIVETAAAGRIVKKPSAAAWSFTDTAPADGTFTYSFAATDAAGKTNITLEKTVVVDTVNPSADLSKVTLPTAFETEGSLFKFTGAADSVKDTGTSSGFDKVEVAFTNNTTAPAAKNFEVTPAANGSWSSTVSFADYSVFGTQGTKYVWLKVTDKAGNTSGWVNGVSFVYDTATPVISLTAANPAEGTYTNTGFTLEATASDTYGVDSVKAVGKVTLNTAPVNWAAVYSKYKTDEACTTAAASTFAAGTYYYPVTLALSSGKYTKAVSTTDIADGKYEFTVTATDRAAKPASVKRTFTIDTIAPQGSFETNNFSPVKAYTENSRDWYSEKAVTFSLRVTDENIDTVEGSLDGTNYSGFSLKNSSYVGTLTGLEEGKNTVTVRMTDKAGNSNSVSTVIYVDKSAPEQENLKTYSIDNANAANLVPSTLLTNQRSNKDVYIEIKDSNYLLTVKPADWDSDCTEYYADAECTTNVTAGTVFTADRYYKMASTGIASVKFGDTEAVKQASGLYKVSIPKTSQSGKVNIAVTDNAGNKAVLSPFTFNTDITKPEVKISPLADADTSDSITQVNKTVTFEGTAKDNQLKQIDVCYYVNGTWKNIYSTTDNPANWATTIDTTTAFGSIADNTEVVLCVIATDEAGNRNIDSGSGSTAVDVAKLDAGGKLIPDSAKVTVAQIADANKFAVTVNQDTDRPVITFTNLTLGDSLTSSSYIPFENNIIYGNIIDDDGLSTVSGDIQYKTDKISWTNLSVSNGSFKITGLEDGQRSVQFKIKDLGGTTFETNGTETPKISDGTNTYSSISELKLKTDTVAPFVESSVQYTRDVSGTPLWDSGIANAVFGGSKNKLYLNQFAWDANGIQGAAVVIPVNPADTGIVTANISGFGWTAADGSSTVYTKSSSIAANTTKFYQDISCRVEGGTITGVNAGNNTITIGSKTYKKEYYRYAWSKVAGSTHSGIYNYEEWRSPEIDVTGMATGSRTITVEVSDGVRATISTLPLAIDNTCPAVSLTQPSSSQYSSGNITAYGTIDSATNMYYALSLDNSTLPGADDTHKGSAITAWTGQDVTTGASKNGTANYEPYYHEINGFGLQWFVYFDGGITTALASHDVSFKQFLIDSGITTAANIQNKSFTDIVNAYLWIKAVDSVGNTTVEKYAVLIDPQGDAPTVTIDYPETDGTTLGGSVSLRGTATDTIGTNIGIDNVWVQIISAKENGYTSTNATQNYTTGGFTFTDTVTSSVINGETTYSHSYTLNGFAPTMKDVKQWYDNGYEVYSGITTTPVKLNSSPAASTNSGADYYIKASFSGSAWTLKINDRAELDPATGKINPVAYRVYAVDKDKTISKAQVQFSVFDSDLPVISSLYLRQYTDNANGTGDVTASREYTDDMWVRGVWWLCGEAKDTQGLNSLKVDGNEINTITKAANATETFKYKLNSGTSVGKLEIEIEAEDNATPKKHSTIKECVINYDNEKPELVTSGANFKISNVIQNSNGFHSFGSQVIEMPVGSAAQSGFKYLAFWYERNISGGKHVVYDIMRAKTKANPGDAYARSEVAWSDLTEDSGLMWKTKTVTRNAASLGTLTLGAVDSNIHVGGLCKIGGSIYMITGVNGVTVSIEGQPEMPKTGTSQTAYFAVASVVNNTIEAGTGNKSTQDGKFGYFESVSNDDGDHMVESVQKSGTTWTWEANINSQNIPDGAVTLHYVAFDAAGNYQEDSILANVSNNGPRLASLRVWSDYNENNSMEEGEYETYYYNGKERKIGGAYVERATGVTNTLVVSGNKKDYTEGGSAFMTVKAATTLKPEVVGGNGALYYTYKTGNASTLASAAVAIGASTIGTGRDDGIDEEVDSNGYYKADENEMGYISGQELTISDLNATKLNSLGNSASAANPTWFEYTIYDSTEGCDSSWNTSTLSTANRLSATFRLALNVQYQDSQKPKAWIRPFHWKKTGKPESGYDLYNSLEWDAEGKVPQGHIELEADLTDAIKTALGNEPKVSGIIKVEGYAFDDIKLKELSVKFSGHSDLNTAKTASTYTGTWSQSAYDATKGWGFTANDVYCNGNGHLVHWVLTVDTAKQANVADSDKPVEITAKDARGNNGTGLTSDADTTQTALTGYTWGTVKNEADAYTTYFTDPCCYTAVTNTTADTAEVYKAEDTMTAYYKVDIVPYITDICNGDMDEGTSGTKQYLRRSASGAFMSSIDDTENANITVKGFNLKGGKVYLGTTQKTTTASGNSLLVTKANIAKSGSIKVINNTYESLNNINNDATPYNKESSTYAPNHVDNRYIYMWDSTTTSYKGTEAVMKPELNAQGNKTGNMSWLYAVNNAKLMANNQLLTDSWAGAVNGGNFAYNSNGVPSWVFLHNMNWMAPERSYEDFGSVQWGKKFEENLWAPWWNTTTDEVTYAYRNARLGLGNLSFLGNTQGYSYNSSVMNRYTNMKMAVAGNNSDATNMVAYFDNATESRSIVFWRFHEGTEIENKNQVLTYTRSQNGFRYAYNANTWSDIKRHVSRTSQYTNGSEGVKVGLDTPKGREEITSSGNDSSYFDMAYDSVKNVVYIAYYDEKAGDLKIKYLNQPTSGTYGNWTNTWSSEVSIDHNAAGQYVSMIIDNSGKVHLAYYDSTGSYLKYALLTPTFNSSNKVTSLAVTKCVIVDALFTNGMYNSITLKEFGTNDIRPVICSYSMSYGGTKYALRTSWPLTTVNNIEAGATTNVQYTGKWETVAVCSQVAPAQDNSFIETKGTGYTGNIVVGYNGSSIEETVLLSE